MDSISFPINLWSFAHLRLFPSLLSALFWGDSLLSSLDGKNLKFKNQSVQYILYWHMAVIWVKDRYIL